MRGVRVSITPAVLSWAREYAGFSIEDCKKRFPKIEQWESGEDAPTYPQLEELAKKFKIPISVFFFPNPPEVPLIRESFRTLPDKEFRAFPQLLLRKAKSFQINLSELHDGRNPSERLIWKEQQFNLRTNIPNMARRIREDLDVSLDQQLGWRDEKEAFEKWRSAIERQGIAVFKDSFKDDSFSGFCLYDETFPIIFINNSVKTRETFTLFHELAHLLFHTSGIALSRDEWGKKPKEEMICNQFAAEFLLPMETLERELSRYQPNTESAAVLAQRYKVSREVVFRRFLDLRLVSREEYEGAANIWTSQKRRGQPGGNHYSTKLVYLGLNYVAAAFSKYYRRNITATELADYLGIQERHLSKFEEYFEKRIS